MIDYKNIELNDREWMEPIINAGEIRGSHYNFANLYAWVETYKYKVALVDGFLLIKGESLDGASYYFFPVGNGDLKSVIAALSLEASNNRHGFRLAGLSKENIGAINRLFPGRFEYKEDRVSFDYVYTLDKMISLQGYKLKSKRNHINFFKKNNTWSFEQICHNNLADCWNMNISWFKERGYEKDIQLINESRASRRCFNCFAELGLEGGLLRSGGKVVAYTVGNKLNSDTFDIILEKAFCEVRGAYQMINREFSKFIRENHPEIVFVNREEDMGSPGLRKAKSSYCPDKMEEKYWGILITHY